jgi:two-component system, OmpR family, copper resistance phosphate regulon response regulator CusR
MRVLLVEDDPHMARFVARGMREQSYAVDIADDGEDALYRASVNDYDIVVLDVMIPMVDGFAVCRELRAKTAQMPILMLTARDAVEDRIRGLDVGADDYLTKPFAFGELLARVRALLRRSGVVRPATVTIANLTVDTGGQRVWRAGREVRLTSKEYALLEFLVLNAGRVVGRAEIAEHVWDESYDPFTNLIEVYINRLRQKIDASSHDTLIHTRRGAGYIVEACSDGPSNEDPSREEES